jgi:Heterokaryon incompatibility protein (HET)
MTVVAGLGESFLWVDATCIVQDDTDEVLAQVKDMAAVYGNGVCCIAAFSSPSADHGLPGVTRARQSDSLQDGTSLGKVSVGLTITRLDQMWDLCPHPKRAWMFQEIQLSRRTLFFTEDEVFWNCVIQFQRESIRKDRHGLFELAYFGAVNVLPNL